MENTTEDGQNVLELTIELPYYDRPIIFPRLNLEATVDTGVSEAQL